MSAPGKGVGIELDGYDLVGAVGILAEIDLGYVDARLLYGVEVKFYNMEVEVSDKLESRYEGLYIIGDGSGITHSLSHASASGVHVARDIAEN